MPIRDIIVTLIVFAVVPMALRHPYVGVMLWEWLSLMNPHRLSWGFAYNFPFAAIGAGVTLAGLFITKDPIRFPRHPAVYLLLAFCAWMCVTTVFAFHFGPSAAQLSKVLKIQLMTLVALLVLHERRHIQMFVWINVLSLGFYGIKGGIYTIQTAGAGRVWGPDGSFVAGNNEIGLAMIITIPLMYYLRLTTENIWVRRGLLVAMGLTAIATIGTTSRGAFLAIMAMSFVLWLRAPGKIISGALLLAFGGLVLAFMPESWHARMDTIINYEQDGSAMGRLHAWATMINLANDRLTGGGFESYTSLIFGLYSPVLDKARAAHSIYFQVLGEHGWIGFALFMLLWLLVWRGASRLRGQTKGVEEFAWIYHLAGMCQVSLVGYAVGGAFLSLAYFDYPYNLLIIVVITQRWLSSQLAARSVDLRPEASHAVKDTADLQATGAMRHSRPLSSRP